MVCKIQHTIRKLGFSSSSYDNALFICKYDGGYTLLLLYVDDIIIYGDDMQGIEELKQFLNTQFEMKDLSHLSYFIVLEVSFDQMGYYLSQAKYATDIFILCQINR